MSESPIQNLLDSPNKICVPPGGRCYCAGTGASGYLRGVVDTGQIIVSGRTDLNAAEFACGTFSSDG